LPTVSGVDLNLKDMKRQSLLLALKTSCIYAVAAGIWIVTSDRLLIFFVSDNVLLTNFQTYKGVFFVSVTAALLFIFLRKQFFTLATTSTERALADSALKESEKKFSNLFNYSPLVHAVTELSTGIYLEVNDKFLTTLQYSRQEIVGHSSLDLSIWADPEDRKRIVLQLRANGIVTNEEVNFKRKNGEVFPGLISMCPIELNGVRCLLTIASDITEQRNMQLALQQSENRSLAIVHTIPDFFFILDRNGIFLDYHAPAANDLFAAPDQFIGKNMRDVLPPELIEKFVPLFEKALTDREMQHVEYSLDVQQEKRFFEARIVSHENDKILSIVRDITEQTIAQEKIKEFYNELEKRVEQRTAELTLANKELEAFSYSVSHDLRAPLRAIDGFSSMLMERYPKMDDPEEKRLLLSIRSNIEKMDGLIDGLLTLSRVGRSEMKKNVTSMTKFVRSIFYEIVPSEQRGRIVFTVNELPDAPADLILIHQVWSNLISNAVKYTAYKDKAIITVIGKRGNDVCKYSISDNGAGFDMENSSKLFGIFQRLHAKTEFDGLGIGLSIVKRIVQRHGGEVGAEGKIGEGAIFSFSLPVK
jgi:PAS domain S-box-containing protein